ncbi:hypothetical protein N9F13_01930 [Akkermansiaceae bacterium]|nr:hypothetical protein [Akkermansiaceae bacterium]
MAAAIGAVIAASVAVASAGLGTYMSFSQASQAKKKQAKAEAMVKDKMSQARKKLETNYMDVLSINKVPFERQREALLSAGAQALEAGIESERGGLATAGRLLAAQNEAQGQVRDAQSERLFDLEAAQAEEDSRLRDIGVQLDLGEVAGAQEAAAASEERAAQMTNQALQGVVNTAGAIGAVAPLYAKGGAARQAGIINRQGGGQAAVNASTMDLSNANAGVKTEAQSKFSTTPQVGYNVGDTIPGVGTVGSPGYMGDVVATKASSDFGPQQNTWDGVDITPIMNNPNQMEFNTFMSKQDPRWAKRYRKEVLDVQRKPFNPFNIF